ncbi:MAG: hypothetical protein RJA70_4711 [Pseudomonadota bacterium]
MTQDFAILGGISLTGRLVPNMLDLGLRPKAIVLGGEDFEDQFAGLAPPSGGASLWWSQHRFLMGGWRSHLEQAARAAGVPVLQGADPYSLLPDTTALVVAGYSRRVPARVTQRYGEWALNVHPSLLPSFGGPQPESQAILQLQSEAGVSVHTMTEIFDAGPLRAQRSFQLDTSFTVADIETRAAALGAECVAEVLLAGTLPSLSVSRAPSYFKWLDEGSEDLARCTSIAEAQRWLRLRPEIYAYFRHAGRTVYPLVADARPCSAPAVALPDGTLYCREWLSRADDGALSHHTCE